MKKLPKLIAAIVIGSSFNTYAQSDFVTAGSNQSGTTGSVSMTIGQVSFTNQSSITGSVSSGAQQVYNIEIIDGVEQKKVNLTLTAYPNPTTENVWLRIGQEFDNQLSYIITDNLGKIVSESEIAESETEINMTGLSSGSYYLMVKDRETNIKTFKIQKSN